MSFKNAILGRYQNLFIAIVICFIALLYVFFIPVSTGFAKLYGDSGDGLIEVSILEHWSNVFSNGNNWKETNYFYPYAGALGYNDTYFVPGLFYSLSRMFFDPLVSTIITHIVAKFLGFFGVFALLRRGISITFWPSILGASLFTVYNSLTMQMVHGQINQLAFAPWALFFLIKIGKSILHNERNDFLIYSSLLSVMYGLWAFSAFYFLWFFSLYIILLIPLLMISLNKVQTYDVKNFVLVNYVSCIACVLLLLLSLVPFFLTYIPMLKIGKTHDWSMISSFLPDPITFFNVGYGNLLWGKFFVATSQHFFPTNYIAGEDIVGFAPLSIILTIVAFVWSWRTRKLWQANLVMVSLVAVGILLTLMMKFPGDFSLWKWVYHYIPGATAIRTVSRFLLFVTIIQISAIVFWLDRANFGKPWKLIISFLLLLEQVQTLPPVDLDRPMTIAMLADVKPMPQACRAGFVISSRTLDQLDADREKFPTPFGVSELEHTQYRDNFFRVYRGNVDAMLIGEILNRPMINGYSTFVPADWNFVNDGRSVMIERARVYAHKQGVGALCGLDRTVSNDWFRINN